MRSRLVIIFFGIILSRPHKPAYAACPGHPSNQPRQSSMTRATSAHAGAMMRGNPPPSIAKRPRENAIWSNTGSLAGRVVSRRGWEPATTVAGQEAAPNVVRTTNIGVPTALPERDIVTRRVAVSQRRESGFPVDAEPKVALLPAALFA